jgi:hypothetical protein
MHLQWLRMLRHLAAQVEPAAESVANAVEQVRATVLRGSSFSPLDEVVAAAPAEIQPAITPGWIPDELYPYPTAG